MKTYLSDVIPSLKRASKKLDDVTAIKNTHWKLIDEETNTRVVYIFRDSNELLISKNGQVERGSWEYLGSNSLLIGVGEKSFLFKQGFYNEYILGLKKDGVDEYAILINEDKINAEIRTLKDLDKVTRIFNSNKVNSSQVSGVNTNTVNNTNHRDRENDEEADTKDNVIATIFIIAIIFAVLMLGFLSQ